MLPSSDPVVILGWKTPSRCELEAQKIADFLGAKATFVPVEGVRDLNSLRRLVPSCAGVAVHADVLLQFSRQMEMGAQGLLNLCEWAPRIFVYGFRPADRYDDTLQVLSSNRLSGVAALPEDERTFRVADGSRQWCAQFEGVSVRGGDPARDSVFKAGAVGDGSAVLIRVGDAPFFVRVDRGECEVFLAGCSELADLDESVGSKASLLPWFSRLVPLMIFLRRVLGQGIWHNESPRACFIIDDPLLKNRYGFLDYKKLLETAGSLGVSVALAFIPWNYRRSRKQTVRLVAGQPGVFSLCVHGCDHTRGEFAITDFDSTRAKARLALDRMQAHGNLYGLPFDEVMVFPQGLFSTQALKGLNACEYLAAVNTDLCPSDAPASLGLRDLLDVAVTKFWGFPLFGRRYPKDVAEFAFDLFLGKPALVVEHHGYFRNGYQEMTAFLGRLKQLDERLEWRNLASICAEACLQRVAPNGDVHLRFYTNRFRLKNNGSRSESYVLFRNVKAHAPLPAVTVNGRELRPERADESIRFALSLEPGQSAEVLVREEVESVPAVSSKASAKQIAAVLIRRALSEFRDDYVDTNRILASLVTSLRRARGAAKGAIQSHSAAA